MQRFDDPGLTAGVQGASRLSALDRIAATVLDSREIG